MLKVHYFSPSTIDGVIAMEGNYFMIFKNFCLVTTLFSLFNLLVLLTQIKRIDLNIFSIVSIIIIIADLFFFGLNLNPLITQKFYSKIPSVLKILKKDSTYCISRFLIEPRTFTETRYFKNYTLYELRTRRQSILMPNFGLMHKVFSVQGYGFLILKDYLRFQAKLGEGKEFSNVLPLLNLSNVKYIISKFKLQTEHLKLIYMERKNGEEIRLYENPSYLKRAFFVPKARVVKDRESILNILSNPEFNPKKEVILEEEVQNSELGISESRTPNPESRIISYQPNKVIIKTSCNQAGFLFLSDTYYPGWKAYIDGVETKIYRANFLFRAIVLPKGNHQVEFVYSPLSFKIGLLGTFITIILLAQVSYFLQKNGLKKGNVP